jgi:hypothetical protein
LFADICHESLLLKEWKVKCDVKSIAEETNNLVVPLEVEDFLVEHKRMPFFQKSLGSLKIQLGSANQREPMVEYPILVYFDGEQQRKENSNNNSEGANTNSVSYFLHIIERQDNF